MTINYSNGLFYIGDLVPLNDEVWKDIVNYEGRYQISNFGRVRSLPRFSSNGEGQQRYVEGKILKPKLDKGYVVIQLKKPGEKYKHHRISRLVAFAFIPNPESRPEVNHIDGNKLNNTVENLEWVTRQENMKHAVKTGLYKDSELRRLAAVEYQSKPVICVDTGVVYPNRKAAELNLHLYHGAVLRSIRFNKPVGGFLFKEVIV